MERDENGNALAKYGKCGRCGRRVSALVDEDFECCEPEPSVPVCEWCEGEGCEDCDE